MRGTRRFRVAGFTLIELLIVVAIIAILAAIAVPNFLEAQVRSKVSRVHSDLRAVTIGIEAYRIDNNAYPLYYNADDGNLLLSRTAWEATVLPYLLTSPVSYLASLMTDPFQATYPLEETGNIKRIGTGSNEKWTYYYRRKGPVRHVSWQGPRFAYEADYQREKIGKAYDVYNHTGWYLGEPETGWVQWVIGSPGPDLLFPALQRAQDPQWFTLQNPRDNYAELHYDPTNGLRSVGDILRFGPA